MSQTNFVRVAQTASAAWQKAAATLPLQQQVHNAEAKLTAATCELSRLRGEVAQEARRLAGLQAPDAPPAAVSARLFGQLGARSVAYQAACTATAELEAARRDLAAFLGR